MALVMRVLLTCYAVDFVALSDWRDFAGLTGAGADKLSHIVGLQRDESDSGAMFSATFV